ncbi:MAG TPA: Npt1/Npt2 family nucleotide transporter [Vicinamibacterales bacterium]|jgi:AAA family ATP:ADP antiporter|nr:Npt1/Npt2 family nucleotide transporter [Vicinamibacterales bacterium]
MFLRLRRFFDVRAGEGLPVLLSFLYVACVVAAFLLAKPIRNGLFLREYGASKLVYAYVAVPLALWAFVRVYTAVAARVGMRLAAIGTLTFFSLNAVGFWAAFRWAPFDLLPGLFYIWVNCFGVIAPVQAWSFANRLFDVRQARRLFGLIGAGASFGALMGGLGARYLVQPVGGAVNLLLVLAALIASAAVIVGVISRRLRRTSPVPKRRQEALPFNEALAAIGSNRYLRLMTALVLLVAIATQWTNFQMSIVADERFAGDADSITRFYGTFNFLTGLAAFVLQLFLTSTLLTRFGVTAVVMILPLGLALGSGLTFLFPVFTAVLFTSSIDYGLRFSVDKAAYELLYLPIPPHERQPIKNALDILGSRIGDAVGGVLLGLATGGFIMLPGAGLGIRGTAAIIFVMTLAWTVVAWRLRRAYVVAIEENIHQHRLDTERISAARLDASVRDALTAHLRSDDANMVAEALENISLLKMPVPSSDLHRLLSHTDIRVRARALAVLGTSGDRTAAPVAERLLRDADLNVRTQALLYLSRAGGFDPLERIAELGDFADFSIRAAMVAFLASPGPARNEEAARILLEQMAASEEPRDRAEAARVLAIVPHPATDVLTTLILDEDQDVAEQAMRTAHSVGSGDVVAALGAALVSRLFEAGAPLRRRLIRTLNKIKQNHPNMELDATLIELLLAAEISGHYRSYQVLAPLDASQPRQQKIIAAVRHSMEQELERIFRLTALLSPSASLHDAYVGLRSSNSLVRANSIEYLENVLKPGLREVLLPLIDSQVTEADRAALAEKVVGPPLESSEQAIGVLLTSDDPWLRSRAEIAANRAAEASAVPEEYTPEPANMDAGIGAG